jgi:hypothetical protein
MSSVRIITYCDVKCRICLERRIIAKKVVKRRTWMNTSIPQDLFIFSCLIPIEINESRKNAVFSDVATFGSCKKGRFGGTYCFHHQNEKNKRARNVSGR